MSKQNIHKKLIELLIFLLFITAIGSIFYSIFGSMNMGKITLSALSYSLGQFFALVGFFFISLLIISGDTARYFDQYFGIDAIIKTQRKFAIVTYFIVFSHPLFIILSRLSYFKYLLPDFADLPLAMGAISLYMFTSIMISSLSYKRISYRIWQYIHIVTYILFFSILYHAVYNGSSIEAIPIKILFYFLTLCVLIGIVYRGYYKLQQRKNKFFIKEVRKETDSTFTLIVESNRNIDFKPGQFFFLRIDGKKLYARHPFSVSSSPQEKNLNFTIKLAGRFTQEAIKFKPGDEIIMEGPFGNFILDTEDKDIVFIAGGVGITPFMSMIQNNQKESIRKNILLFYSSKTEKEIIFKKELDAIHGPWLEKVYVLSGEKKENYEIRRIDKEMLKKYVHDFQNKKFYICGPQLMNKDVSKALLELGVQEENIIFEDFFW